MTAFSIALVFQNTSTAGEAVGVSAVLHSKPVFLIGRDSRCHLVSADPKIAPSHAAIVYRDDHYRIKTTLPRLELWVNGNLVDGEQPLKLGDVIRVGYTELRVIESQQLAQRTASVTPAPTAIQPAVQVRPATLPARPAPSAAALEKSAPAQEPVIYFPPTMQPSPAGRNPVAVFGALATLILVAGFIFTMVSNLNTASTARTVPLSLVDNRDGMVRLMMFDADW